MDVCTNTGVLLADVWKEGSEQSRQQAWATGGPQCQTATSSFHPVGFTCTLCGKLYKWRTNLQRHMRLECGKAPQFQCPHCGKRFSRHDVLCAHIRSVHRHLFADDNKFMF
ncbi:hypothetical protein PR048_000163 [Dryococelus australis]|uniref:C2H2-type domain-containing protein n=1 Tax=Dryococelus australis TaxID=614101 RepID=A0ABQ9IE23_9NEOP|nr:hypothetical protein PR048_000163 [Dryococelus australis]